MEMLWICVVAITYVMLLCAFLVYRKIKSIDEYYDREFERLSVRVGRLDDHLYELKQKVDKVQKVEAKPIPCTEWTPTTGKNPGLDLNKRFQHVWKAYDDTWERIDEIEDELKELKDDVERHEELFNSVSMFADGLHDRLNYLEKRVLRPEKEGAECAPE